LKLKLGLFSEFSERYAKRCRIGAKTWDLGNPLVKRANGKSLDANCIMQNFE